MFPGRRAGRGVNRHAGACRTRSAGPAGNGRQCQSRCREISVQLRGIGNQRGRSDRTRAGFSIPHSSPGRKSCCARRKLWECTLGRRQRIQIDSVAVPADSFGNGVWRQKRRFGEIERGAVQLIGSALGDDVNLIRAETILRRISFALNLEFLNGVLRQNYCRSVQRRIGIDQSVEGVVVRGGAPAIDADRIALAWRI